MDDERTPLWQGSTSVDEDRTPLWQSGLAHFALSVAQAISALACLLCLVLGTMGLFTGLGTNEFPVFFKSALAIFIAAPMNFALFVVFTHTKQCVFHGPKRSDHQKP